MQLLMSFGALLLIISRVAHTPCLCTQCNNLHQLLLYMMAGYWHLQIQSVVSTHLIMHKSVCANNNKVIYGTNTKKQSHKNLEQRASTEDALSTRELVIHKSITDRYLVLKTSIWGEGPNVNIF